MIKEACGILVVELDCWHKAHTVKRFVLSFTGKIIIYPRINEILGNLHARNISNFLVTNGYHPHAIENIIPIMQLYVIVDASTL